jgi:hypothetical protein
MVSLIFQPLSGRVYVNLLEGNIHEIHPFQHHLSRIERGWINGGSLEGSESKRWGVWWRALILIGEPWGAPTPSCAMWGPRDAKGTLVCKVDLWWLMYFWDRLKPPSGPEFPYWSGQKSDFVQNGGKAWYVDFGEKNFSHIVNENLQTWANQSYSVGIVIIWIKTAIVKEYRFQVGQVLRKAMPGLRMVNSAIKAQKFTIL